MLFTQKLVRFFLIVDTLAKVDFVCISKNLFLRCTIKNIQPCQTLQQE
jgi:hypothetical protein